jgi:hypothetical protein
MDDVAIVEFQEAEAVPAALSKKRLDDAEIDVTMMWKADLFVTNFAPDLNDEGIRAMFSKVKLRWNG